MKMVKIVTIILLLVFTIQGADTTIKSKDMSSFAMGGSLKDQIKAEIMLDINVTFGLFKQDLERNLIEKFKRSEHTFKSDVIALKKEVKLLQEQITLFKDMIVDTNYQRNVRDDRVRLLMESTKEIEQRLNKLENKKEPPLDNKTGEKI
jgi:vacuolar-type H+-ATPase subunit I/STV1